MFPLYRVPTVTVAAATLLMAMAVLALRPGDRVHRAFSAFLFFRGGAYLFVALDPSPGALLDRFSMYFFLAIPWAALWFAREFHLHFARRKLAGAPRIDPAAVSLLSVGVGLEVWYALDHSMSIGGASFVSWFFEASYVAYGVVAWLLARDHGSAPEGQHRRALWLLSLGMVVEAMFRPARLLSEAAVLVAKGDFPASGWVDAALLAVAFGMGVLAIVTVSRNLRLGEGTARYAWTAGMAAGSGVVVYALYSVLPTSVARLTQFLTEGFWILLLVLLSAYALLRCRLFGIELRTKRLLTTGTVAAPFAAVFFLAGESLENPVQGWLGISGYWISLAAAALITLALSPLQRLATAFANRLLPDVEDTPAYRVRRSKEMYQAAVEDAVDDRVITERERRMLESVRSHLRLNEQQARGLEKAVLLSVLSAAPA